MSYYDAWKSGGLELPPKPKEMTSWRDTMELAKDEGYLMDSSLKEVSMVLKWDAECDVDASVALFNRDGVHVDQVWWKKLQSECGTVRHSGDSLTGVGKEEDEIISVDLAEIPLSIHFLLFVLCVFSPDKSFSEAKSGCVKMITGKKKQQDLLRYNLTQLSGNAMLLGMLSRTGAYWKFTALGQPATGRTIMEVAKDKESLTTLHFEASSWPIERLISLTVLEGRNLAPKDRGFFREPTSDPFFRIKYKTIEFRSPHVPKTLSPKWVVDPVNLGSILVSSPKAVKVTVWDYDFLAKPDFMGSLWIPAAALYNLGVGQHELWFKLSEGKRELAKAFVSGEIKVKIIVSDKRIEE